MRHAFLDARAFERKGKDKEAARLYARAALDWFSLRPLRGWVAIHRAIRLAPNSPRLVAVAAVLAYRIGWRAHAFFHTNNFFGMIEHRANHFAYVTFFEQLAQEYPELVRRMRPKPSPPIEEVTLSQMVVEVAHRLDLNLSPRSNFPGAKEFVSALKSPLEARVATDLAVAFFEMGLFEESLLVLELVSVHDNGSMGVKAEILFTQKHWLDLATHCHHWMGYHPQNEALIECHFKLALALHRLGEWEKCEKHVRFLEAHSPGYRNMLQLGLATRSLNSKDEHVS